MSHVCGRDADCDAECSRPIKNPKLEKARLEREEILRILNTPGMTREQRRELLKEKGFAEVLIDELLRKDDVADY